MHSYKKFELSNGLRVIHLEDKSRTTIVLNTLYNVGARDESPNRTGFAHLFEHLMFSGSANVPLFDKEVEEAGGQNNAFTTNEITNYHLVMPRENIETAFWLESDRMKSLNINEKSLSVQRGVVVEEFKQRCYNAPFGFLWHHIRKIVYSQSPYRWPTIGESIEHIETASLEEVQAFYNQFYGPQNAIVSVVGDISLNQTKLLCEKWFGDIKKLESANQNNYLQEKKPSSRRFLESLDVSPNPAVFLVWRGPVFLDPRSINLDLFAELLGGSDVSPLQLELVKSKQLLNAAECFYMRGLAEGLFVLYGIMNDGVSHLTCEKALLDVCKSLFLPSSTLKKSMQGCINRQLSHLLFEAVQPMQLAQKLCYYENAGDLEGINKEVSHLENASLKAVLTDASATLTDESVSVIYYHPKKNDRL